MIILHDGSGDGEIRIADIVENIIDRFYPDAVLRSVVGGDNDICDAGVGHTAGKGDRVSEPSVRRHGDIDRAAVHRCHVGVGDIPLDFHLAGRCQGHGGIRISDFKRPGSPIYGDHRIVLHGTSAAASAIPYRSPEVKRPRDGRENLPGAIGICDHICLRWEKAGA